jgi:hypothetical protein
MTNPTIDLPSNWINCCREYAEKVVVDYANGRNAKSRAVTCFDAHDNITLQATAKMCECAFAVWAGMDPARLNWSGFCDNGTDIIWRSKRWDIKATKIGGQYLIWPITKNEIYDSKQFDCLALVKFAVPTFELAGWISKGEFSATHEIATDGHKLFSGTWYVHQDRLWDLTSLMMS